MKLRQIVSGECQQWSAPVKGSRPSEYLNTADIAQDILHENIPYFLVGFHTCPSKRLRVCTHGKDHPANSRENTPDAVIRMIREWSSLVQHQSSSPSNELTCSIALQPVPINIRDVLFGSRRVDHVSKDTNTVDVKVNCRHNIHDSLLIGRRLRPLHSRARSLSIGLGLGRKRTLLRRHLLVRGLVTKGNVIIRKDFLQSKDSEIEAGLELLYL